MRVADSKFNNFYETNSYTKCVFRNTSFHNFRGALQTFTDCVFENCTFTMLTEANIRFTRCTFTGGEASGGPRPCGCLGGRGFAFLSHVGALQTCGFIEKPCGNIRDFNYDLRALAAAAANPLGERGSCRGIIA